MKTVAEKKQTAKRWRENNKEYFSEKILKLLLDINKSGTSVIMTTHNYNLIRKYKKRILKCENGYLKEATI